MEGCVRVGFRANPRILRHSDREDQRFKEGSSMADCGVHRSYCIDACRGNAKWEGRNVFAFHSFAAHQVHMHQDMRPVQRTAGTVISNCTSTPPS